MADYGKKFIQRLFAKWTKGDRVRYEFERRVQADSDRGDIGVFEIGIPAQRHGDHLESPRDASSAEGLRLIEIAKANNLYFHKTQWEQFGDRKRLPSGESIVYLSADATTITKIRNPFAKSAIKNLSPSDIIYEHLIHNIFFPNTHYSFVGITDDIDGVRIIYQQPYIPLKFISPSQKQIDKYLLDFLCLTKENSYFYGNDYISITDVNADGDNVLVDEKGTLFFIDPIIRLKKPAKEILEHYYQILE